MYGKALMKSAYLYLLISSIGIIATVVIFIACFLPRLQDEKIDFNNTFEISATVESVEIEQVGKNRTWIIINNEEYIDFVLENAQDFEKFEDIKTLKKGEIITVRMDNGEKVWLEEENEYMSSKIFSLKTEKEELLSFDAYNENIVKEKIMIYARYIPLLIVIVAIAVFSAIKVKRMKIEPKPSRLIKD